MAVGHHPHFLNIGRVRRKDKNMKTYVDDSGDWTELALEDLSEVCCSECGNCFLDVYCDSEPWVASGTNLRCWGCADEDSRLAASVNQAFYETIILGGQN